MHNVFVAISKRLEDEIRRLEIEKEIGKTRYGPIRRSRA